MGYQKIQVPAGDKITVNADMTLRYQPCNDQSG